MSGAPAAPIATSAVPEELLAPMSEILFSEEWKELTRIWIDFSGESRSSVEERLFAGIRHHFQHYPDSPLAEFEISFLQKIASGCQIPSLQDFFNGDGFEEEHQRKRSRLDAVMAKFEAILFPRGQDKSEPEKSLEAIYRVERVQTEVRGRLGDWEADFAAEQSSRKSLVQGALELAEYRHPHLFKQMKSYSDEIFRFLFSNIALRGWNNKQLLEVTERLVVRLGTMFKSAGQIMVSEPYKNNFLYRVMQDVVDSFKPVG